MRPQGTPQALEQRRLQAVRLLESGHSYRSVADQVHSSLSSVVRWHQSYRERGRKGLRARASPGRPALLSIDQRKTLLEILVRGPLARGYLTDLWTLRRIGDVIDKEFGIRYSLANCWKVMTALGWSCQKPAKRARERDEGAIRTWKRSVWPQIQLVMKPPYDRPSAPMRVESMNGYRASR